MQNKTFLYDLIKKKSIELNIDDIGICLIEEYEKTNNNDNNFLSPKIFFKEAKTIISAAYSYNFEWNNENNNASGYIAHYTVCNFYKILYKKLNELGLFIKNNFYKEIPKDKLFKISVNSKLNDKKIAITCGIGNILKNNLISIKNKGTKFILGELILSVQIENDIKINNQNTECGKCNKCIESCPTGALKEYGLDKNLCLQHLTTKLNLDKKFIKFWGKRFYGCTDCVDSCPKNNHIKNENDFNYLGYVSKTFNIKNIIIFKKGEYKKYFTNNQISNSWINEIVLVRNALIGLYNSNEIDIIKKYITNMDLYGWNEEEKKYLLDFCYFLLKQ